MNARDKVENLLLSAAVLIAAVTVLLCLAGCDSSSWPANSIILPSKSEQKQSLDQVPLPAPDVHVTITAPASQPADGPGAVVRLSSTGDVLATIPPGHSMNIDKVWGNVQKHDWDMHSEVGGMRTTGDFKPGGTVPMATTTMPAMDRLATTQPSSQPAQVGGAGTPAAPITQAPDTGNPVEDALARAGLTRMQVICIGLGVFLILAGAVAWYFLRALPYGWKVGGGMTAAGVLLLAAAWMLQHWIVMLVLGGVGLIGAVLLVWYSQKKHQSIGTTAGNIVAAVEKLPAQARDAMTGNVSAVSKATGTESTTRAVVNQLKATQTVRDVLAEENKQPATPAAAGDPLLRPPTGGA